MSDEVKENPLGITLPVKWNVPEGTIGRYVQNVIVQPGQYEFNIFFFENQVPPFVGGPEEIREKLLKEGEIRADCVAKIIVDPELMPGIIAALQDALNKYNEAKEFMAGKKD